jgi:hypothetical protein
MISKRRRLWVMIAVGLILASLLLPLTAWGQSPPTLSAQMSQTTASLLVGETVRFNTTVRNTGTAATSPLVAHLNIASLQPGVYVDPEDWSSSRTRYLEPLQPGETVTINWMVRALTEGDFAAYVTMVAADPAFVPVTGSPLLIHANPSHILPMKKVLPVIIAVPLVPLAFVFWGIAQDLRRRRTAPTPPGTK